MKIEVSKTELTAALEVAGRAVNPKAPQPIYSTLMLETVGDYLQVTGTDGEVTLTALAALEGVERGEGKVAVIGEGFMTVVKGMKGARVALTQERNTLVVKSGRSKYCLPLVTGEAWPVIPKVAEQVTFTVDEKRLAAALTQVVPAMGTDGSRPTICGTYWDLSEDGRLSLVATDTHRLHMARLTTAEASGAGSFILGAQASKELAKVLTAEGHECRISTDGACVKVVTRHGIFVSVLISGNYVAYERFIPEKNTYAEFEQGELEEAIRRASFVAQGAADRLVVSITAKGTVLLEAASEAYGQAEEELSVVAGEAGAQQFAVSSRNLGAAVAAVPDSVVRLYRSPAARGILVSGDDTEEFFAVVIPMRLPSDA